MPGIPTGLGRWIAAAAGALVPIGIVVAAAGAPVAWLVLAATAAVVVAVLVPSLRERRFFEPLTVIAAVVGIGFVLRPLQLFLGSRDLLSWVPPEPGVHALLELENQEIAHFVTRYMAGPLEPALTRATVAVAVFFALVIAGYVLPLGATWARRVSRVGERSAAIDVRVVVAVCLLLGLCGQVAVVARTGGLAEVADSQLQQRALYAGLGLHVLAGFAIVGVLIWAAWRRPASRAAWAAFVAAALEVALFYALAGSRTRVLASAVALIVIVHYLWRPLTLRVLLVAGVAGLLFAGASLAVRQATADKSFGEALADAPEYIADPRGMLNDTTEYDQLFVATAVIGDSLPRKHGGWLVGAFHSYVPGFLDPDKPEPADVEFRKAVWGESVQAGRPTTVIGDFYYDFGFPGIAVGSLLLGVLARALLGLVASARRPGHEYRVALYAIGLITLHQLVIGTYSMALAVLVTVALPYLVAVHVIGRISVGRMSALRIGPSRARARART